MSFLTIPQNYAPGFVPQRYLYLNDSAAGQLTAQLTDTRTGEEIASLALHNLWMPEIDVSAFLRRIAAPVPFETGATGLHLPEQRTLTLSMQIGADQAADRIYLPATAATEEGEPLTALPNVRLIGAGETDEISFNCHSQASATLSVTTGSGRADKTYSETGTGVVLFHLNAAAFSNASAFDLTVRIADRTTKLHYEVMQSSPAGRRVAWLNEKGGIDRYTFPLVEQRDYTVERNRYRLVESGYVQSDVACEERLSLGSAYEPAAVLEALARIPAAPAAWIAAAEGWIPIDIVTDTLRIGRQGVLQHLTLEIRARQKGVRL